MGEYKNGTTPSILYQKGGVDLEEESGTQTKADDLVHCEIDNFWKKWPWQKFSAKPNPVFYAVQK